MLLDLCLPHIPELLGSQEASQKKIIRLTLFQLPLIPEKELITVFFPLAQRWLGIIIRAVIIHANCLFGEGESMREKPQTPPQ